MHTSKATAWTADELHDDEHRSRRRGDAGEGVRQRAGEVTAGLAKLVEDVNQ